MFHTLVPALNRARVPAGNLDRDAARRGDSTAVQMLRTVSSYLGVALANLVNLLNPGLILLGEPNGEASPLLAGMIQEEVRMRSMAYPWSVVEITQSSLGAVADPIGASVPVLQKLDELFFNTREHMQDSVSSPAFLESAG